jgi:hypothetical protein
MAVPQEAFGDLDTPETNPLLEAPAGFWLRVSPQPVSFSYQLKEKTHATRKTRHETPGSA